MMMKTIAKTLTLFALICYLAVSSIAAVHAIPSFNDQSDRMQAEQISLPSDEMQPSCHQNVDKSTDAKSVSLCELFCSAMGNVISNEIFIDVDSLQPIQDINSLAQVFPTRPVTLEPHPPK